jgi:hypothetical protein
MSSSTEHTAPDRAVWEAEDLGIEVRSGHAEQIRCGVPQGFFRTRSGSERRRRVWMIGRDIIAPTVFEDPNVGSILWANARQAEVRVALEQSGQFVVWTIDLPTLCAEDAAAGANPLRNIDRIKSLEAAHLAESPWVARQTFRCSKPPSTRAF